MVEEKQKELIKECYKRPIQLNSWPKNCKYIMFVDENNSASIVNIVKRKLINNEKVSVDENVFTVTGCIFEKDEYYNFSKKLEALKEKYWREGVYKSNKNINEYVCFHTEEIKSRKNAFHKSVLNDKKYQQFIEELDLIIKNTKYKIISINIKIDDFIKYSTFKNMDLYNIAFNFIVERFCYETGTNDKIAIVFEARGKKEDKLLLKHINIIVNTNGTEYLNSMTISNKLCGVYFNPKKNRQGISYVGLEIADLSSYPIHRYVKYDRIGKDFETIITKISGYPNNLKRGLKVYPNKK